MADEPVVTPDEAPLAGSPTIPPVEDARNAEDERKARAPKSIAKEVAAGLWG